MDMTVSQLTCKRCEYKWFPRSEAMPHVCPKCKSYSWQTEARGK